MKKGSDGKVIARVLANLLRYFFHCFLHNKTKSLLSNG